MVMQVVVPSRRIDPIMVVLAHRPQGRGSTRAATRASAEAGGVVEEDEPIGIKAVGPPQPGFDNIVPVLLASSERLFLYVSPMSTQYVM